LVAVSVIFGSGRVGSPVHSHLLVLFPDKNKLLLLFKKGGKIRNLDSLKNSC
jgi:hypothetical protein